VIGRIEPSPATEVSQGGPRRSRVDDITAGATDWTAVTLVDLDGNGPLIRTVLEEFGARVSRVPIGQSRHLLGALSGADPAEFV
jgi:hypothetical protein